MSTSRCYQHTDVEKSAIRARERIYGGHPNSYRAMGRFIWSPGARSIPVCILFALFVLCCLLEPGMHPRSCSCVGGGGHERLMVNR